MFSFVSGIAILSVGPVGAALLRLSPETLINNYGIAKYKVYILSSLGAHSLIHLGVVFGDILR